MSWRIVGCMGIAAAIFVVIGLVGLSMATSGSIGCPERLQWNERAYLPLGAPTERPTIPGIAEPALLANTHIGLTTREVYVDPAQVPQGSDAPGSGTPPPAEIALECGDGTFQAYREAAS